MSNYSSEEILELFTNDNLSKKEEQKILIDLLLSGDINVDTNKELFYQCLVVTKVKHNVLQNIFIRYSSGLGWIKSVEYLMNCCDIDPSFAENDSLFRACEIGDLNMVKLLLTDKRVSTIESNWNLLEMSNKLQHFHICEYALTLKETKSTLYHLQASKKEKILENIKIHKLIRKVNQF